MQRKAALLAALLLAAHALVGVEAAAAPAKGAKSSGGGSDKETIDACQAVMAWIGVNFPPNGTMFCPTDRAFKKFAKDSGYEDWATMWARIKSEPASWLAYLNRVLMYHVSKTYLPGQTVPKGGIQVDTLSPVSLTAAGRATGYQPLLVDVKGYRRNGDPKLVVYSAEYVANGTSSSSGSSSGSDGGSSSSSSALVGAATWRRRVKRKHRVRVVGVDLVNLVESGGVVHSVEEVMMPPNTFTTVRAALKATKNWRTASHVVRRQLQDRLDVSASRSVFFAPDNDAFDVLNRKSKKKANKWAGGITTFRLRGKEKLASAVMEYMSVNMTVAGLKKAVTRDTLIQAWKAANKAEPYSFIGLPTGLQVDGEAQTALIWYDADGDNVFLVGSRNELSAPYMAAAVVGSDVVYAGCSTMLTITGNIPLPRRTGVDKFDASN